MLDLKSCDYELHFLESSSCRTHILSGSCVNIAKLMYGMLKNLSLHDMKFGNDNRYQIWVSYTFKNLFSFNGEAREKLTMLNLRP